MRRLRALPLLPLVLAAYGGSSKTDAAACKGLPTAKHARPPVFVSGAIPNLNKRGLCAQYGSPTSIRKLSDQREIWFYGNVTFELYKGHVGGWGASGPAS